MHTALFGIHVMAAEMLCCFVVVVVGARRKQE